MDSAFKDRPLKGKSHEKIVAAADSVEGGIGMAADVRDFESVDKALATTVEQFGKIDIVVSGAAGNFVAPALGMSSNGFKTVVDIDLIGTFNVLRASFQYLNRPGASLMSITAPQAHNPSMFQAHVCAAKAGINMLTQCLAMEWGPAGVRVNAISPGPIADTEGMARLAPTPEMEAAVKASVAMRATVRSLILQMWLCTSRLKMPATSPGPFLIAMAVPSLEMRAVTLLASLPE